MHADGCVSVGLMDPNRTFPFLVHATTAGLSLLEWSRENRDRVERDLAKHGAILFRGFEADGQAEFEAVIDSLFGKKLDYVYRTTPRTQVGKGVYTATEFPAHLTIPYHNENSYQRDWPMILAFFCVRAAEEGGETPIADSIAVTARIDESVKDKFRQKRVMYVRNYRKGFDIPWQTVFQSDSKPEVESYCRQHDIEFEWKGDDWLRTRQVCHALASHPNTGQEIWFNQAHMFHISSLDERTRKVLLGLFGEDGVPRNSYYGDGEPIEEAALANIRKAFDAEGFVFPWHPNDLLLLDNMRFAHSRNPFKGERRILVSMANPYSSALKAKKATA